MKIHFLVLPLSWTQLQIQSRCRRNFFPRNGELICGGEIFVLVVIAVCLKKKHRETTLGFMGVLQV